MKTENVVETKKPSKGISVSEKQKIEALIDMRVRAVSDHLSSLSNVGASISEYIPFSKQNELNEIISLKVQTQLQLDAINSNKQAKLKATLKVVEEDYRRKKARLEKMLKDLDAKYNEVDKAVNEEVIKEFSDQEFKLQEIMGNLATSLQDLNKQAENEKQLKVYGLQESINNLRSGLQDRRNQAVEHVWTGKDTTEVMREALLMIPESTAFRNNFSVSNFTGHILDIVASNSKLLTNKTTCPKCNAKNNKLRWESSGLYCTNCGHYVESKRDIIPVAALPTFEQITKNIGVSKTPEVQPVPTQPAQ